jgi:Zn-dependent protease
MLPRESNQHAMIELRLRALEARAPAAKARNDDLGTAILKTAGSMLLSIVIYYFYAGRSWGFAAGFVILILVHELGHVIANRYYGIHASPPIFIPFLGAVINLRQPPTNAREEAVIGIAGPIAGTLGALACYAYWLRTGNALAYDLAHIAFFLNLFNLLPVPPLDGGRVAAAISPWVWILGLIGMGGLAVRDIARGRDVSILILILVFALPRIAITLKTGARNGAYYQIGRRASATVAVSYLLLVGFLAALYYATGKIS